MARAYIHPNGELFSDATTARDAFARPPAIAGLHLDSEGTGSCAVYDRAHGIAATTQGGDTVGSSIGFAPPPPVPDVPGADLSRVTSERGLHLGMSVADLEHVFGKAHHVRYSPDKKRAYYYYRRTPNSARNRVAAPGPAGPPGTLVASDALAIFTSGKATYISLVEVGI